MTSAVKASRPASSGLPSRRDSSDKPGMSAFHQSGHSLTADMRSQAGVVTRLHLCSWLGLIEAMISINPRPASEQIDYRVAAKFTDVFRRLVLERAIAPARPLWYDWSSFRRQFASGQPSV